MSRPEFPGAAAPERTHTLESAGVPLRLHEWGDPAATPVLLCHGMFDHARGFDTLAPLLATRFRVVAIDARGHGDSGWADAYLWPMDVDDLVRVLESLDKPAHLVGHSRGGGQATDAAVRAPDRVRRLVNIDGFGPPHEEDRPQRMRHVELSVPGAFARFLEMRLDPTSLSWRPAASLAELCERRARQNPRLSAEWLRYFVFHGARETEDGWVWKGDPLARFGFGPWKPEWIAPFWAHLRVPLLAVTGDQPDSWGPIPDDLLAERLASVETFERATVSDAGHFVHMEKPAETADLLLGFLET